LQFTLYEGIIMVAENASSTKNIQDTYFEGERLELLWQYVYTPEFIPLLIDYIGIKSGMKVLDVGCGTAFFSRILAKHVDDIHVVGIEFDEKLVSIGQALIERDNLGSKIKIQKGDAYKLTFPDESFDLVTSHTLL